MVVGTANRGLTILLALALAGCAGTTLPSWNTHGSEQQQRKTAERFDPYPSSEMAPAVVGGRPLGYEIPKSETQQVRQAMPQY